MASSQLLYKLHVHVFDALQPAEHVKDISVQLAEQLTANRQAAAAEAAADALAEQVASSE